MRAVFGLVLVVGMALAGFAVYMVKGYLGNTEAQLAAERARTAQAVQTVEIYAVNRAIGYGEPLTMEDVVVIRYAEPYLPEGTFATEEALFSDGAENPRYVLRPMEKNEPILAAKVTAPGEIAGITSRLSRGMRAFTIRVDVTTGVSGFLRPGDRVDVYWSGNIPNPNGIGSQSVTKLIQSGVELIAVDQTADGNRSGAEIARTVTVQVSPTDVAALTQAQSSGNLTLSLVGQDDDAIAANIEVNQSTLLGLSAPVEEVIAAPAPAARVCTIRKRVGAEVVEEVIPCTN